MRDFYAYGLGTGIPPSSGYFLAQFCHRYSGTLGARLPEPVRLARLLGIPSPYSKVRTYNLAVIIAFLRAHGFVTVESDDSLTLTERGVAWWKQFDRPVAKDELRGLLLAAGLGRVADVIEHQALPSIRLTVHPVENEDALPVGVSKLGGSPDLPLNYEWPHNGEFPMAFIAQINLAEAAQYDNQELLPDSGMLYFFLDYAHLYDTWRTPSDVQNVLYTEGVLTHLQCRAMPPPLPEWLLPWNRPHYGPYQPCSIAFSADLTLPDYLPYYDASWHSRIRERLGPITEPFTEEAREAYGDVQRRLRGPAYNINRMLGHPDPIQGINVFPEEVLLLQVDSEDDAGMMWGDVGRLYWWMQRDELARRDFSSVKFDEQCS
jgi:uncharacterized protein YwqG